MSSNSWTWSDPHQDYYYATYDHNGSLIYTWARGRSENASAQPTTAQSTNEESARVSDSIFPGQGQNAPEPGPVSRTESGEGKGIGGCGPYDNLSPYQSHSAVPESASLYNASASQSQGRGQPLHGTWNPQDPQSGSHYEQLDPSFYVRSKDFFSMGKVFSVIFTEPARSTLTNYNDSISLVRFGEHVHAQVRRFVVVRQKREFCYAIPIFTYGGQGTKKPGVEPEEHTIAYSYGKQPALLADEHLSKDPICIVMNESEQPLSTASRIFFGICHPIQYNVKVKDLGYVHPEHMAKLLGYWAMENQGETMQDAEVTASGAFEEIGE